MYRADGEAVRVECPRYSHLKKYTRPYRALMRRSAAGAWHIHDEYSESQP